MLDYLESVEQRLPALLQDEDGWKDLFVTYETPNVERLYRQDGENRIYLHRIHWCALSFYHPHPWPSAMRLVEGAYQMSVGLEKLSVATIQLEPGSCYEMVNPESWHSVMPLSPTTLSLMVTGPVWKKTEKSTMTNSALTSEQRQALFADFRRYYK
jgi:hypothetical protein